MPVRHVLVVDDSKSARLMLRRMLQGFGLSVDTVDSAEEALAYLRNQRPDAIFMDHTMPGLDGLTAVRRIKEDLETADIPVTMYTSKDEPAYQDEARTAGAMGVLIKPATPDAISTALEEMNVLFDAAVAARLAKAPPPPVSTAEAMTAAQFEKIASEKAEGIVYDAIESQVLPLINDVIAKVRRDLDTGQEQKWERIVARICDQRLAQWQAPKPDPRDIQAIVETVIQSQLPPLLAERFEVFRREGWVEIEGQVRTMAGQAYQDQLQELSDRLTQQLSSHLTEVVTQKVEESTRAAAIEAARGVAVQAIAEAMTAQPIEVSPEVVAEQTFERLWASAKSEVWRRIHWSAAWSAAIGIGAALLVYWVAVKAIAA